MLSQGENRVVGIAGVIEIMPLTIGEAVGPYRIVEQLGQGGMATVYRAYHPYLERDVAIKVLHAALKSDPSFEERFRREAQIVAKLEHPNIVPVYDYNQHNGEPYLVMKFVEGETLKARMARQPLTLPETIRILNAVSAALSYAHERDILHRDIKPSNILIDTRGEIYLADFGLARIASAGESTLSKDMLLGTPQYISPEQAQGTTALSAATDIYSLGVVIYEIIVGRTPYTADTPYAIIHGHIYAPLPLPSKVNPNVPASVERVLLKVLAKDPPDRYPRAVDFAQAFQDAVQKAGVTDFGAGKVHIAPEGIDSKVRGAASGAGVDPKTPFSMPAPNTINIPGVNAGATQKNVATGKMRPQRRSGGALIAVLAGVAALILIAAVVIIWGSRGSDNNMAVAETGAAQTGTALAQMSSLTPTEGTPPPTLSPAPTATPVLPPTLPPSWTPIPSRTPAPTSDPASMPTSALRPTNARPTRGAVRTAIAGGSAFDPLRSTAEEARQFIKDNPNDPRGYLVMALLLGASNAANELAEAADMARQALTLSRGNLETLTVMETAISALKRVRPSDLADNFHAGVWAYIYDAVSGPAAVPQPARAEAGEALFRYTSETTNQNGHVSTLKQVTATTNNGYLLSLYAMALAKAGLKDESLYALDKALKVPPIFPETSLVQGIILKAFGDGAGAQAAFEQASARLAPPWVRSEAVKHQ